MVLPNKISIPLVDDDAIKQALLYQPPMVSKCIFLWHRMILKYVIASGTYFYDVVFTVFDDVV